MEDTSSTSSDERIKSKTRMRRERRAQKYPTTLYRDVTLFTVITRFFRLHLSAPLYPHVVCTHDCQPKCEASLAHTWTADVNTQVDTQEFGRGAEPRAGRARKRLLTLLDPCEERPQGPHSGGAILAQAILLKRRVACALDEVRLQCL